MLPVEAEHEQTAVLCRSKGERCQAGEQHTAHSSSFPCHVGMQRLPSSPFSCRCLSNLQSGLSVCSLPLSHFDLLLQRTDLLPQGGHLSLGAGCAGVGCACLVLPAAALPAACCQHRVSFRAVGVEELSPRASRLACAPTSCTAASLSSRVPTLQSGG